MNDFEKLTLDLNKENKEIKPALALIKEATGLTDFKEILQKMERHSETI